LIGDVKEFVSTYAKNVRNDNNIKNNNNNNDNIDNEYPLLTFIVAADVFMYVGDLEDILLSCYDVLKVSIAGLFCYISIFYYMYVDISFIIGIFLLIPYWPVCINRVDIRFHETLVCILYK
jgi:hypothetical protein